MDIIIIEFWTSKHLIPLHSIRSLKFSTLSQTEKKSMLPYSQYRHLCDSEWHEQCIETVVYIMKYTKKADQNIKWHEKHLDQWHYESQEVHSRFEIRNMRFEIGYSKLECQVYFLLIRFKSGYISPLKDP